MVNGALMAMGRDDGLISDPDIMDTDCMVAYFSENPSCRYNAQIEDGRCLSHSLEDRRAMPSSECSPVFRSAFANLRLITNRFREADQPGVKQLIWNLIEDNWDQIRELVKERWGALSDEELAVIAGNRDMLAMKLQERYGFELERAEQELEQFTGASEFKHGYS